MATYIALLRGINVSGQKMIKMAALLEMFNALGVKNAKTYIQSGNVVFRYKEKNGPALEKKIELKIKETFGFEVPVMVIDAAELPAILQHNPYIKIKNVDIGRLYLVFLSAVPSPELLEKIAQGNYGDDKFSISGKVIYLHLPSNYGNTKLNNNFFESKLKLKATARNWKTMNELQKIAGSIQDL